MVTDVEKGYIVQPLNRMFHCTLMPKHMFRVEVVWVIPGYKDQYPPVPPADPEEEMNLGGCLGSLMLWPKAIIRLDSTSTTSESGPSQPRFTPAMVPSFAMANPAEPPLEPHFSKKQYALDDFIIDLDDNHHHDHTPNHEASSGEVDLMSKASKRRLFKSRETPEVAPYTGDQTAGRPSFLTTNTLKWVVGDGIVATTTPRKKNKRKRPDKKGKGSYNQSAPKKHVLERIHMPYWSEIHELGELILPEQDLATLTGDMRSLHDTILHLEKIRMQENNPSYPLFKVNMQKALGFIYIGIGSPFLVRHADVFNKFHLRKLHHSIVRLVALGMAS
jgi:hypothetical protein